MNLQELERYLKEEEVEQPLATESSPDPVSADNDVAPVTENAVNGRLQEAEMACRLGYLLCQCTWPPQIMVLGREGFEFHCPRCHRSRDF